MNNPRNLMCAGLVYLGLVVGLQAETLVQYAFTNNATSATTSGVNVVTASMNRGAGLSSVTRSTGTGAVTPNGSIFVEGSKVDEEISATSTDWVGFTIAAAPGYALNLASFSFDYAFTYAGGTAPVSATFDVRSSVLGYGVSIGAIETPAVNIGTNPVWLPASVVLTGGDYQNLNSITFRIYLNDGNNESASSYLRLDTITLGGVAVTVVPEPSTYAMMSGAGALLTAVSFRRRKR
jgi:hypothetical protein